MRPKIMLLFIIFVFSIFTFVPASALSTSPSGFSSQTDENVSSDCYGLDIIFIIDQSGSMSGKNNAPPNDPTGQRFYAPRYALDWLANNRLGLCPKAIHRMAVISFGDDATIDLPLTPIIPNSQDDWDRIRGGLEERIKPEDMGATNPLRAFEEAYAIIKSSEPLGELPRKRAVIMLTDGSPCVGSLGCGIEADTMNHDAYNASFLRFVQKNFEFSDAVRKRDDAIKRAELIYGSLENIPPDERNNLVDENPVPSIDLETSTYIYIVAMNNDKMYSVRDGNLFTQIATGFGGELLNLKQNQTEIPRVFNQIMSGLAGVTPQLLSCGNLAVQPYLAGAVLDVYKVGEDISVNITLNGRSLTKGAGDTDFFGVVDYTSFGAIEHYRFSKPQAGLWKVDASNCDGIEASFIPFAANVSKIEPSGIIPQYDLDGQTSDPRYPYHLRYQIFDAANPDIVLEQNEIYPIDINVTISDPAGKQFTTKLNFVDSKWKSTTPIPVHLLGEYNLSVTGVAPCLKNPDKPQICPEPTFKVFENIRDSYIVGNVSIFKILIKNPQNGANIPLHGTLSEKLEIQHLQVEIEIVDENSLPISYQKILVDEPNMAFEATLKAEGQSGEEKLMLYVDPENSSHFLGEFTNLQETGFYQLHVELVGKYQNDKYRPFENPVSIRFSRNDPIWQNPNFYLFILAIFLIGIFILFGYLIWMRTNPVRGRLDFINPSGDVRPVSVAKGLRIVRITTLSVFGLKKIEVRNGVGRGGKQTIEIDFYPKTGSKFHRTLQDGSMPVPINSDWRVQYIWKKR